MPRDSNGVYFLPAGNPVVSGTVIDPVWANTTLDDIALALTNSLDKSDPNEAGQILGLGTAAYKNTGASGDAVPLLNGTNTWSAKQTFTSNPSISSAAGAITFLSLQRDLVNRAALILPAATPEILNIALYDAAGANARNKIVVNYDEGVQMRYLTTVRAETTATGFSVTGLLESSAGATVKGGDLVVDRTAGTTNPRALLKGQATQTCQWQSYIGNETTAVLRHTASWVNPSNYWQTLAYDAAGANGQTGLRHTYAGGVDLFYAGNKRLSTTVDGVYVDVATTTPADAAHFGLNAPANQNSSYDNHEAGVLRVSFGWSGALNASYWQIFNASGASPQNVVSSSYDGNTILHAEGVGVFNLGVGRATLDGSLSVVDPTTSNSWEFEVINFGGTDAVLSSQQNSASLTLQTRSSGGTGYSFLFGADGFLTLPQALPTNDSHAASKGYVDDRAVQYAAQVTSAGALAGAARSITSITKGTAGVYTINLSRALSAVGAAIPVATGYNSAGDGTEVTVQAIATNVNTVVVRTRINGSLADTAFSFMMMDAGD